MSSDLGPGAQGPSVRLLQSELNALHYVVPLDGVFDEATGRAVIAYRKVTGLARVAPPNAHVFELLAARSGQLPRALSRRTAAMSRRTSPNRCSRRSNRAGACGPIYTMSSGKPSTPTVIGHFHVYSKTPGVNSEGMVDSNYFIRGYAIHGYPKCQPTLPATAACACRFPTPRRSSVGCGGHGG